MVPFSAVPSTVKFVPAPLRILTLSPVQRMYCCAVGFDGVSGTLSVGGVGADGVSLGEFGRFGVVESLSESSGISGSKPLSRFELPLVFGIPVSGDSTSVVAHAAVVKSDSAASNAAMDFFLMIYSFALCLAASRLVEFRHALVGLADTRMIPHSRSGGNSQPLEKMEECGKPCKKTAIRCQVWGIFPCNLSAFIV